MIYTGGSKLFHPWTAFKKKVNLLSDIICYYMKKWNVTTLHFDIFATVSLVIFHFVYTYKCIIKLIRLHWMHEMQTIVTDDCIVCLSVSLSVTRGHLVQPLPNHFGLCFYLRLPEAETSLLMHKFNQTNAYTCS